MGTAESDAIECSTRPTRWCYWSKKIDNQTGRPWTLSNFRPDVSWPRRRWVACHRTMKRTVCRGSFAADVLVPIANPIIVISITHRVFRGFHCHRHYVSIVQYCRRNCPQVLSGRCLSTLLLAFVVLLSSLHLRPHPLSNQRVWSVGNLDHAKPAIPLVTAGERTLTTYHRTPKVNFHVLLTPLRCHLVYRYLRPKWRRMSGSVDTFLSGAIVEPLVELAST